jgi:hypothetical protein
MPAAPGIVETEVWRDRGLIEGLETPLVTKLVLGHGLTQTLSPALGMFVRRNLRLTVVQSGHWPPRAGSDPDARALLAWFVCLSVPPAVGKRTRTLDLNYEALNRPRSITRGRGPANPAPRDLKAPPKVLHKFNLRV